MKRDIALALAAVLPSTLLADETKHPSLPPIMAMGAYIPTSDMNRSKRFYSTLFDSKPLMEHPDFVAFNVAGGWFAIVSREKYAPGSVPGSGSVPYLQSSNLEALQARAIETGLAAPQIIEEPGIHLLKITDPNGQLIEFFKLADE